MYVFYVNLVKACYYRNYCKLSSSWNSKRYCFRTSKRTSKSLACPPLATKPFWKRSQRFVWHVQRIIVK